jgi:hypothetical protein
MKMDPLGPMNYPSRKPDLRVEKVNVPQQTNDPFDYLKEKFMGIDKDKITTIAGGTAAVCTGLLFSGILVPATAVYIATVGIGTIAGGIFAFFTNKPSPFVKPEDKKK